MDVGNSGESGAEDREVQLWVQRLLDGTRDDRTHAATELGRLGVWTRGSVRTRGTLTRAAANRLPDPASVDMVIRALRDADRTIRCQVARALGEWGGAEAAMALAALLRSEDDPDVRLYAVHALRTIGGPQAVEALRQSAEAGGEAECDAALSAIEELATGGSLQDTEPPPTNQQRASGLSSQDSQTPQRVRGAVRTRGAVRMSGTSAATGDPAGEDPLTATLQRVRAREGTSAYLRIRAGEVLRRLKG